MSDLSTLGGRLKHAMKALGLTPSAFATRLNLKTTVQISQWTKNRRIPERDRIVEMAEILGVSTDWILTGNGKGPSAEMSGRGGIPEALWPKVKQFERDMVRLDANDRELDYIGAILRLPETADLLVKDDDGDRLAIFGANEEFGILARALEWWVRARVARRAKPEGWQLPPSDEDLLGKRLPKSPPPKPGGSKRASGSE